MNTKPILWATSLVLALSFSACTTVSKPPTTKPQPQPTPVGTPTADAIKKTIGAEGGSLSSADGKLTLMVAAGAVSAPTEFSIQPISNNTPGALGQAYRLSPHQTFAAPIQLSFSYSDADLKGTIPEALGIAFQNDQGLWEWQKTVKLDSSAKTLTVSSTHFSDWSRVYGLQLDPASTAVRVGQAVHLEVQNCVLPKDDGRVYMVKCSGDDDDIEPLVPEVKKETWSVNGTVGGTSGTGTIQGTTSSANYIAPASRPASNPVAVSVEATTKEGKKTLLVSNITVVGGQTWSGTFTRTKTTTQAGSKTTYSILAEVAFEYNPTNLQYRLVGGSVSEDFAFDMLNRNPTCRTSWSASGTIKPSDGEMFIVGSKYNGYGATDADYKGSSTCNDENKPEPYNGKAHINWWTQHVPLAIKPDGKTIDDTYTDVEGATVHIHLTAP